MSRARSKRGLPLLLVATVVAQMIVFLVRPASTYRAIDLDAPVALLGAIGAVFAVVPLALAIPTGRLADRVGPVTMMRAGAVITVGAAGVLLLAASSIEGLILGNAVLGAGHLATLVGQQTYVAQSSAGTHMDTRFARYTLATALGQALGPGVLAAVGGSAVAPDVGQLFVLGLALSVGLAGISVAMVSGSSPSAVPPQQVRASSADLLRMPGVVRAITVSAVVFAAVDLTLIFIPMLGAERGYSAATVGALLTVRAAASMVSRMGLGRLSQRFGRMPIMAVSLAVATICLAAAAVPLPVPAVYVVIVGLGLGLGVIQPLTMSWIAETAPAGLLGRAMAIRIAGNRIAQVVIPSGVGVLGASLGAAGVLSGTAVVVGASALLLRRHGLDR